MAETNIDSIDSIVELLELYDIIQDVKERRKEETSLSLQCVA